MCAPCGNRLTTLHSRQQLLLLAGVTASCRFESCLVDDSCSARRAPQSTSLSSICCRERARPLRFAFLPVCSLCRQHTNTHTCIITSLAKKERAHTHTQRITTCITNSFGYFVRCTLCFHRTDAYYALFPPLLFQCTDCLLACTLSPQTACTACNYSALARTPHTPRSLTLSLFHSPSLLRTFCCCLPLNTFSCAHFAALRCRRRCLAKS